jgi:hypothetical protein
MGDCVDQGLGFFSGSHRGDFSSNVSPGRVLAEVKTLEVRFLVASVCLLPLRLHMFSKLQICTSKRAAAPVLCSDDLMTNISHKSTHGGANDGSVGSAMY